MSREMIEPWRQYGVKLEKEEMVDGVLHHCVKVQESQREMDKEHVIQYRLQTKRKHKKQLPKCKSEQ